MITLPVARLGRADSACIEVVNEGFLKLIKHTAFDAASSFQVSIDVIEKIGEALQRGIADAGKTSPTDAAHEKPGILPLRTCI